MKTHSVSGTSRGRGRAHTPAGDHAIAEPEFGGFLSRMVTRRERNFQSECGAIPRLIAHGIDQRIKLGDSAEELVTKLKNIRPLGSRHLLACMAPPGPFRS